jgi:hypothetical protein
MFVPFFFKNFQDVDWRWLNSYKNQRLQKRWDKSTHGTLCHDGKNKKTQHRFVNQQICLTKWLHLHSKLIITKVTLKEVQN